MKILVIRFSSIGDIVLTSPIIRCLKQQIPDSEIHFLTKENFSTIVLNNIYIDKVFILKISLNEVLAQLKVEKYDLIIDLHKNIRSLYIKLVLGVKSYSFRKLNFKKWLFVNFKINILPDIHIVDRYFEATKSLNIKNDYNGIDYFISEYDQVGINSLPINFHTGFAILVIGGKHFTKQIPDNILIELCKTTKIPLLLLGGNEDREKAEKIRKSADNRDVFNACGLYNINQSASLLELSKLIITPDTGLMHIASAFKIKIISVWGNTVPAFGMYPYLPKGNNSEIIQVKGLKCRPCSKIGFEKCPEKHFDCMNKIEISLLNKHLQ